MGWTGEMISESGICHEFHLIGNNLIDDSFSSIAGDVLLGSNPSDDMDTGSLLQLVEIPDILPFPCEYTMPGGFDDSTSVLRFEAVIGCDGEVGTFGVSEVLDVIAPDDAPDFNSVQLFHGD